MAFQLTYNFQPNHDFYHQLNLFIRNDGNFSYQNYRLDLINFWKDYDYTNFNVHELMFDIVDHFCNRFGINSDALRTMVNRNIFRNIVISSMNQFPELKNPVVLSSLIEEVVNYAKIFACPLMDLPNDNDYYSSEEEDEYDSEEDEYYSEDDDDDFVYSE